MTLDNYRTNLTSRNPVQQAEFIGIAASVGDLDAIAFILPFVRHSESEVRVAAVNALCRIGDLAQIGALEDRLYDGSRKVQVAAVNTLSSLAGPDAEPELVEKLSRSMVMHNRTSDELPVLKATILSLGRIGGKQSMEALSSLAYQPELAATFHPELSASLARLYVKGPEIFALSALFEILPQYTDSIPRPEVHRNITWIAGELGKKGELPTFFRHLAAVEQQAAFLGTAGFLKGKVVSSLRSRMDGLMEPPLKMRTVASPHAAAKLKA